MKQSEMIVSLNTTSSLCIITPCTVNTQIGLWNVNEEHLAGLLKQPNDFLLMSDGVLVKQFIGINTNISAAVDIASVYNKPCARITIYFNIDSIDTGPGDETDRYNGVLCTSGIDR